MKFLKVELLGQKACDLSFSYPKLYQGIIPLAVSESLFFCAFVNKMDF